MSMAGRARSLVSSVIAPPFSASDLDAAQGDRQLRVALADELHFVIGDDLEAIPLMLAKQAMLGRAETGRCLRSGHEEGLAIIDLSPPVEAAIPLVKDVGDASLERSLPANLDVIDGGSRHVDHGWDIHLGIVDDMQLHTSDTAVPLRPRTNLAERDWTGINEAHHLLALTVQLPACHCR